MRFSSEKIFCDASRRSRFKQTVSLRRLRGNRWSFGTNIAKIPPPAFFGDFFYDENTCGGFWRNLLVSKGCIEKKKCGSANRAGRSLAPAEARYSHSSFTRSLRRLLPEYLKYMLPFARPKGNRKAAAVKRFRGRSCDFAKSDACGTFEAIKSSLTQSFSRLGKARTSSTLPSAYHVPAAG